MNELIKIHPYKGTKIDAKNVVNARDLHTFIGSKQHFADWIKNRIGKYGFIEGKDFTSFHKVIKREIVGGTSQIQYAITIEMAKELAMVEGNEMGKKARLFFIECEKKLIEQNFLNLSDPNHVLKITQKWADEYNLRIAAEQKIEVLQPKADLMDKVMEMDDMVDIGQAAKILKLPFGRNKLFIKLREKGVFFKNRNEPMQEYVERGLFSVKQKLITRTSGDFLVTKTLVSQKGLDYIDKLFSNKNQLSLL